MPPPEARVTCSDAEGERKMVLSLSFLKKKKKNVENAKSSVASFLKISLSQ